MRLNMKWMALAAATLLCMSSFVADAQPQKVAPYDGKTYKWKDANGAEHTSTLSSEKITNPYQMMGLLGYLYTNPDIPGFKTKYNYHGSDQRSPSEQDDVVHRPTSSSGNFNEDCKDTEVNYDLHSYQLVAYEPKANYDVNDWENTTNTYLYYPTIHDNGAVDYKALLANPDMALIEDPRVSWIRKSLIDNNESARKVIADANEEGATVLFVQIKDSWKYEDIYPYIRSQYLPADSRYQESIVNPGMWEGEKYHAPSDQVDLELFTNAIESVQLISNPIRVSDEANNGANSGYLLGIDEVTTSRFFYLAKGRTRQYSRRMPPFYATYEQISPHTHAMEEWQQADIVETLNKGKRFPFIHDCVNALSGDESNNSWTPHYASATSGDAEARALKGLTLWLPDKRFNDNMNYQTSISHPEGGKYTPNLFLYRAHLDAVATEANKWGNTHDKGANYMNGYFVIDLDWFTRLKLESLGASIDEYFKVYMVDDNGNQTLLRTNITNNNDYEVLPGEDNIPAPAKNLNNYSFAVKQKEQAQTLRFIVLASPDQNFNDANFPQAYSNVAEVIIPGTADRVYITASHRSKFEPTGVEKNIYKNTITLKANIQNPEQTFIGKAFTLYRSTSATRSAADEKAVATLDFITNFIDQDPDYFIDVVYSNQDAEHTFDNEATWLTAGQDNHVARVRIADVYGTSERNNIILYDYFTDDLTDGESESKYYYYLVENNNFASNTATVIMPATKIANLQRASYTASEIEGDTQRRMTLKDYDVNFTYNLHEDVDETVDHVQVFRIVDNNTKTVSRAKYMGYDNGQNDYEVYGIHKETDLLTKFVANVRTSFGSSEAEGEDYLVNKGIYEAQYVPMITTNIWTGMNDYYVNTYGNLKHSITLPKLTVTASQPMQWSTREKDPNHPDVDKYFDFYLTKLVLAPEIPDDINDVYLYRVWRVEPNGTEVLLNTQPAPRYIDVKDGSEYQTTYTVLNTSDILGDPTKKNQPLEFTDYMEVDEFTGGTMQYIIRMYTHNGAPTPAPGRHRAPSNQYYLTEKTVNVDLEDVITAIENVNSNAVAVSTVYYNVMGQASSKPWDGINIECQIMSDGTMVSRKVVK